MSDLADRKCTPCEGGIDPLDRDRVDELLDQVAGWQLTDNGCSIRRDFQFTDFLKTMSFINAIAWIANRQGHHPDLNAGYNYCPCHVYDTCNQGIVRK